MTIENEDGETAIDCAVFEGHLNLVEIFKKHVFAQKMEKKQNETFVIKKRSNALQLPVHNEQMLTPNQANYNFDATSPYFINVTHRRKPIAYEPRGDTLDNLISVDPLLVTADVIQPELTDDETINGTDTNSGSAETVVVRKNLFQLTEENLSKHSSSFTRLNRTTIVDKWRKKVTIPRDRRSILPSDHSDLDSFIETFNEQLSVSHMSTPKVTVQPKSHAIGGGGAENGADAGVTNGVARAEQFETDTETYMTAQDNVEAKQLCPNDNMTIAEIKGLIKSPRRDDECNVQIEAYKHTDNEFDVVFYEQVCYGNNVAKGAALPNVANGNEDANTSISSAPSTQVTIPLDYDTDDLRRELTNFGQPPGPITKNTKKLYLKKLIKYKRNNAQAPTKQAAKAPSKCTYLIFYFMALISYKYIPFIFRILIGIGTDPSS